MAVNIRIIGNYVFILNASQYFRELASLCTFNLKKFNYIASSNERSVNIEARRCYLIDKLERSNRLVFICYQGLLTRIRRFFNQRQIEYIIKSDLRLSEDRFRVNQSYLEAINFRPFQKECILKIIRSRSGLIVCPTGAGKTFILAVLAKIFDKANILIITKSLSTISEIKRNCEKLDLDIGVVDGSVKTEPNKRIIVASIASIEKCNPKRFDFVFADECHELVTDKRRACFYRFSRARLFGFTATPIRTDGAHFHLEEIFGPVIYKVSFCQAVDKKIIVPVVVCWYRVRNGPSVSNFDSIVVRKKVGLWFNFERNKVIAQAAKTFFDQGLQVLILVDTVSHALELSRLLPDFLVCTASIDQRLLERAQRRGYKCIEQLKDAIENREKYANDFRDRKIMGIIATGIWSTGISFDDLEVLIRADGKVSKISDIQAPGRVCRIPSSANLNKQFGIVVDFIDEFCDYFFRRSKQRFSTYKQLGWLQCDSDWRQLTRL